MTKTFLERAEAKALALMDEWMATNPLDHAAYAGGEARAKIVERIARGRNNRTVMMIFMLLLERKAGGQGHQFIGSISFYEEYKETRRCRTRRPLRQQASGRRQAHGSQST